MELETKPKQIKWNKTKQIGLGRKHNRQDLEQN